MPRIARSKLNTPFLHVMVQGVNKEYIFKKREYMEQYLKIIKDNLNEEAYTIMSYCIMNNHAHFLVYVKDINEFGKFMKKVNFLYAKIYNKKQCRVGVLFRNRYRAEPIYEKMYLINCIKYIHNNPVKAHIVSKCEEYKYSSYNDFIKNGNITQTKIMTDIFGKNCNYLELFKSTYEKRYIDNEEEDEETIKEYIAEGLKEYMKVYSKTLIDVFSNRDVLKELIQYLKEKCNIKYVEIKKYFEIPSGIINYLVKG